MLLAVAKRDNEDERTLGELFYLMVSEVADLSFNESMLLIISVMMDAVKDILFPDDGYADKRAAGAFLGQFPETFTAQSPATLGCVAFFFAPGLIFSWALGCFACGKFKVPIIESIAQLCFSKTPMYQSIFYLYRTLASTQYGPSTYHDSRILPAYRSVSFSLDPDEFLL